MNLSFDFAFILMYYLTFQLITRFSSMIWNQRMQASMLTWLLRLLIHWWVLNIITLHWIIIWCWKEILETKMYGKLLPMHANYHFNFLPVICFSRWLFLSCNLMGMYILESLNLLFIFLLEITILVSLHNNSSFRGVVCSMIWYWNFYDWVV